MCVLQRVLERFDVVILDLNMPKMSGIDFMKEVVKNPELKKIPIIMITASAADDSKKLVREINPDLAGYIVKPYKTERLMELIRLWVK